MIFFSQGVEFIDSQTPWLTGGWLLPRKTKSWHLQLTGISFLGILLSGAHQACREGGFREKGRDFEQNNHSKSGQLIFLGFKSLPSLFNKSSINSFQLLSNPLMLSHRELLIKGKSGCCELSLLTTLWQWMCGAPMAGSRPIFWRVPIGCPTMYFNSDTNYLKLVQTSQVKGSVPRWPTLLSDLAANWKFPGSPPPLLRLENLV